MRFEIVKLDAPVIGVKMDGLVAPVHPLQLSGALPIWADGDNVMVTRNDGHARGKTHPVRMQISGH